MKDDENRPKRSLKDRIKYHFVDSTAITATVTPMFALMETSVAGMSSEQSLNARVLSVGLNYMGFGRTFSKGLDISRKLFGIKGETSEKVRQLHDAAYAVTYCGVFQPVFYYFVGVRSPREIAIGTAGVMGLALVVGGPVGYAIDMFRDLTGLKKCERKSYPGLLKKQNSNIKKGFAALLVAGSIGACAGIYALT